MAELWALACSIADSNWGSLTSMDHSQTATSASSSSKKAYLTVIDVVSSSAAMLVAIRKATTVHPTAAVDDDEQFMQADANSDVIEASILNYHHPNFFLSAP